MAEKDVKALTPEQIAESISGLASGLKTLSETVTVVADGNKGIVENIANLTKQISELPNVSVKEPEKEPEPISDTDIESMDRMKFANFIGGTIMRKIKESVLDPLETRLSSIDESLGNNDLRSEISQVAKNHDDFKLYKEDILKLSEEKPNHSIEDLYTLAKVADPEKGNSEQDDLERDKNKPTNVIDFGGLLPTSGSTSETTGNQDADSAADAAWDSVVGDSAVAKGPES